jgi:hypothetical protein
VQARYSFPQPVDLSQKDILGVSLRGDTSDIPNVDLMFADVHDVFYGVQLAGVNGIRSWVKNLALPRNLFGFYFRTTPDTTRRFIDWSAINRFFVVVKRPGGTQPVTASGRLAIDHCQTDRAADWPRQQQFDTVQAGDANAHARAALYIAGQQRSTGLCVSWKEEPDPKAWLYDQALALIVLTREGVWTNGVAASDAAVRAGALAAFITARQKPDGHWPRAWNPVTGAELVDDQWVGDQAWWVTALAQFASRSGDPAASASAERGAAWLASRVGAGGSVVPSTEATVDTWWAMIATGRYATADAIQDYLLRRMWDPAMRYWYRGVYNDTLPDPGIAMDCATWTSAFARSPRVNRPDMGLAALSFARRTLVTSDSAGSLCGFDGQGPVGIWIEGTAQYVSAGGQDAQQFLDMLLSLQRPDGGMPGSVMATEGNTLVWLTTWTGLSSTAWLYFALTSPPFPEGSTIESAIDGSLPGTFLLHQNYPNPFNPTTTIRYALPTRSQVTLTVFNPLGQRVATLVEGEREAGHHEARFDASGLATGVYLYRLQAGEFVRSRRLLFLR